MSFCNSSLWIQCYMYTFTFEISQLYSYSFKERFFLFFFLTCMHFLFFCFCFICNIFLKASREDFLPLISQKEEYLWGVSQNGWLTCFVFDGCEFWRISLVLLAKWALLPMSWGQTLHFVPLWWFNVSSWWQFLQVHNAARKYFWLFLVYRWIIFPADSHAVAQKHAH